MELESVEVRLRGGSEQDIPVLYQEWPLSCIECLGSGGPQHRYALTHGMPSVKMCIQPCRTATHNCHNWVISHADCVTGDGTVYLYMSITTDQFSEAFCEMQSKLKSDYLINHLINQSFIWQKCKNNKIFFGSNEHASMLNYFYLPCLILHLRFVQLKSDQSVDEKLSSHHSSSHGGRRMSSFITIHQVVADTSHWTPPYNSCSRNINDKIVQNKLHQDIFKADM